MLFLAAGLLTVRLAGGRFSMLAQLSSRGAWLIVLALLLQILAIYVLVRPPHVLAASLHLFSYGLAGASLWLNRRLRGMPFAAAGGALTLLAIAANGATMPATAAALRSAGIKG